MTFCLSICLYVWLSFWWIDRQTDIAWGQYYSSKCFTHHYQRPYNLSPHLLSVAVIVSGKQKQLQLLKIRQLDARRRPEGKYRRRPPLLKRYAGDVLAPVISLRFHTYRINVFLINGTIYLANLSVHIQTDHYIYNSQSHIHIYQSSTKM